MKDINQHNVASLRKQLESAVSKEPRLSAYGLGFSHDSRYTLAEKKDELEKRRNELLSSVDQFQLACSWLRMQKRTKNITKHLTSYALKHRVEDWCRRNKDDCYISNGAFIAAAIHLGFLYKESDHDSPNIYINISRRLVECEN